MNLPLEWLSNKEKLRKTLDLLMLLMKLKFVYATKVLFSLHSENSTFSSLNISM